MNEQIIIGNCKSFEIEIEIVIQSLAHKLMRIVVSKHFNGTTSPFSKFFFSNEKQSCPCVNRVFLFLFINIQFWMNTADRG